MHLRDRKECTEIESTLREADICGGFGQFLSTLSAREYAHKIVHYRERNSETDAVSTLGGARGAVQYKHLFKQ